MASNCACLICTVTVGDKQESVECTTCSGWTHRKCAKLSAEAYRTLSASNNNIQYLCDDCLSKPDNTPPTPTNLKSNLENITSMLQLIIQNQQKTDAALLERPTRTEVVDIVESKIVDKVDDMVEKKVNAAVKEATEKNKRRCNIIVSNIPESDPQDTSHTDTETVLEELKTILPTIEKPDITDLRRLGPKTAKPRKICVILCSEDKKKAILKATRTRTYPDSTPTSERCYINADLTPKEQIKHKELRDELKRRKNEGETDLVIRRGEVVTRTQADNES